MVGYAEDGAILSCPTGLREWLGATPEANDIRSLFAEYPEVAAYLLPSDEAKGGGPTFASKGRFFQVDSLPNPMGQMNSHFAVLNDVTQAIKSLERAHRQISELEHFAYVISHDLNEPLRLIQSFGGLLHEEYLHALDEQGQSYLNFLTQSTAKAKGLIDALLDYNRATRAKVKPRPIILLDIISLQMEQLQAELAERALINLEVYSSEPLLGDPKWMGKVFYHLLHNAIIYSGQETPSVLIQHEAIDHNNRIVVRNEGVAIPAKYLEEIFLPFRSLNKHKQETRGGMGLAICSQILMKHKGSIWAENTPDGVEIVMLWPQTIES